MAIQYTPSLSLPYPEVSDTPLIASRDLRALAQKMDSEGAQIRGESTAALTAGQAAEALAAQALSRAQSIEEPIHVGPAEPTNGEDLWVDTDADGGEGTQVSAADITDATPVGRNVLTAPLAVDARNALDIWTGTRALLDAGTDTAERTWDAKELHEYVTDQVAAGGGAASWDDLTGKPATFPPSAHTHAQADVTGLADALASLTYDSGVRSLNALIAGRASGDLTIEKVGSVVTVAAWNLKMSASGSGSLIPDVLPFGWRPSVTMGGTMQGLSSRLQVTFAGNLQAYNWTAGSGIFGSFTYIARGIPDTKPGDPA